MTRNSSQYRDGRNRYSKNQAKRKVIMVIIGAIIGFLLYKYFFGESESPVMTVPTKNFDKSSLYTGNDFRTGDWTLKESGVNNVKEMSQTNGESAQNNTHVHANVKDGEDGWDGDRKGGDIDEELKSNAKEDGLRTHMDRLSGSKDGERESGDNLTASNKTVDKTNHRNTTTGAKSVAETKVSVNKTLDTSKNVNGTIYTDGKSVTNITSVSNETDTFKGNTHDNKLEAVAKQEKDCVKFRMVVLNKANTRMCQHNISDDELFVEIVKDDVEWKMKHLAIVENATRENPSLVSIDIGCGTGVFTLLAAKFVRKALAIDPYLENLRVLHRAVTAMNVSGVREMWYMVSNSSSTTNKTMDSVARTTLDDIAKTHVLPNETAVVSVSQGGYELEVLLGGRRFFNTTRICFVLVNFSKQRTRDTGPNIVNFMKQFDLHPHKDMKTSLTDVPATKFESSVIFRRNFIDCLSKFK